MQKTIIGVLAATGLLISGAAANAQIIDKQTISFTGTTASYGAAFTGAARGQTFDEDFVFSIGQPSPLSSSVISIALGNALGVTLTAFRLDNATEATLVNGTEFSTNPSSWTLAASNLPAGTYILDVEGVVNGINGGSFGGNINLTSPVPETSTTAMLVGGLALVGFAATRRRKNKDAAPRTGMFAT